MSLEADIKAINDGLVDSRLKGHHGTVTHPTENLERTYCVFCGAPMGGVSQDSGEFIRANNVVVVCRRCDDNMREKYGPLPLLEAPIQEYNVEAIRDTIAFEEQPIQSEWIENCIDCRVPMIKLQIMAASKCAPLLDTLRIGECVMDKNRTEAVRKAIPNATPSWFCRRCRSLWGPIDMFWCKFKKL